MTLEINTGNQFRFRHLAQTPEFSPFYKINAGLFLSKTPTASQTQAATVPRCFVHLVFYLSVFVASPLICDSQPRMYLYQPCH